VRDYAVELRRYSSEDLRYAAVEDEGVDARAILPEGGVEVERSVVTVDIREMSVKVRNETCKKGEGERSRTLPPISFLDVLDFQRARCRGLEDCKKRAGMHSV